MRKYGFGQSVRRAEDPRLLTGRGRFTADIDLPGQTWGVVLRSPHAHAGIAGIDVAAARAAPGVLTVLTGDDAAADGLGGFPTLDGMGAAEGAAQPPPPRPVLAAERVRFVGEPVAFLVAETLSQAQDAAELVAVEYEPLPAVTDTAAALAPDAPQIWPQVPGNLAVDFRAGDAAATEAAFARATHRVRLPLINNRVMGTPMEPVAAIGDYHAGEGRYTLHCPSQGVHVVRKVLAEEVLRIPGWALRVVTGDVGGGFGVRVFAIPEHALVLWAARRAGRPVKWVAGRTETMLADVHARDHVTAAELALDSEGHLLALRVDTIAALGAYLSADGRDVPTRGYAASITGIYDLPLFSLRTRAVHTNTVPTDAYRGAGRPEAMYVIERLVDAAAAALGIPGDALRRRNLVPPTAMPFTTAPGEEIDSGDFPANLESALDLADADGMPARKAAAAARGRRRGLGMAVYMKINGGMPDELAEARFDSGGGLTILIGTQSNGQGHETVYAQLAADRLGVPFESVRVVQGDSDRIAHGRGTGGSCALSVGGSAVVMVADKVIAAGQRFAAHLLEAAEADIAFADGAYLVAGTDRTVGMTEVARAAFRPGPHTAALGFGLAERHLYLPRGKTFANGCHVCEVEVDPETGQVAILAYTVVDDYGRIMNPMLVDGQVHGGVAQGVGQALLESCAYDAGSGQLLSASFMDYALPRAADLPRFTIAYNEVPCATNPLGVKGVGEAGTTGSMPAVVGAVADALAPLGIRHIDMPLTPERVWRAIHGR